MDDVDARQACAPSLHRHLAELLSAGLRRGDFAGAVVRIETGGRLRAELTDGYALRYRWQADAQRVDPLVPPRPMGADTLFDVASLTKLVTTLGMLSEASARRLDLDAPLAVHLPALAGGDKATLSARQLLQHRSGLLPWLPLYLQATRREEVVDCIARSPLQATAPTHRHYSDLNFILLGAALEAISGKRLDSFVHRSLLRPLSLLHSGFAPALALPAVRNVAATSHGNPFEKRMLDDPAVGVRHRGPERSGHFSHWRRQTLQGQVNDANAFHACAQVAGHAGFFTTAGDLCALLRLFCPTATSEQRRVNLAPATMAETFADAARGNFLGWESAANLAPINPIQDLGHDPLAHRSLFHTGFTGTFVFFDPAHETLVTVLTNRQHRADAAGNYAQLRPLYVSTVRAAYAAYPASP